MSFVAAQNGIQLLTLLLPQPLPHRVNEPLTMTIHTVFSNSNCCLYQRLFIIVLDSFRSKRSGSVAPEVILRKCVTCMPPPSANKAAQSGFETQRRPHQKSKTGVSVDPQKVLMSSNKNLKKVSGASFHQ